MRRMAAILAAGLLALAGAAHAGGVTFEYLYAYGHPTGVSSDGNTIAGNNPSWGPYRWTQAGGIQDLGMVPTPSPGGAPGISGDGTVVASTILGADSTYSTSGIWHLPGTWQQLMPPGGPADLYLMDRNYSDVWALSGDGSTVVGLYWRHVSGASAHAYKWTQATGAVDLGSLNGSSRANCVDWDGNVIAGWTTDLTGARLAAVWDHGTLTGLTPAGSVGGEGQATNANGDIIVGYEYDPVTTIRGPARWRRTNGTWGATEHLPAVSGTIPSGYGINVANGVSPDGRLVVGYCSFDGSPYNPAGFVWTDSTGTVDAATWLSLSGVYVDPGFLIESLQCMSSDGLTIIGFGQDLVPPFTLRTFRIRIPKTAGVAPGGPERRLALDSPRPNPSAGRTALDFTLPEGGTANLAIFDAAGRRVATLADGWMPAGTHAASWDGRGDGGMTVAAGLYWARLVTAHGSATQRLVRIR